MPNGREKTFAETLVEFALEDKMEHQAYMAKIPADKLAAYIGRKGKLIIDGDEGGEFIIKMTRHGVFSDDSEGDVRNEIRMSDSTFMEIVIGDLAPKAAIARGQVYFTGSRSLYDSHEIMDIFQEWMEHKLVPIAKKIFRGLE